MNSFLCVYYDFGGIGCEGRAIIGGLAGTDLPLKRNNWEDLNAFWKWTTAWKELSS